MFDFFRRTQIKQDTAPGTLIYTGEKRDFPSSVVKVAFNEAEIAEEVVLPSALSSCIDGSQTVLLKATGVHDPEFVRSVGACFALPPIVLEDVMNTGQRSKILWIDDKTMFIILKNILIEENKVKTDQVSLFRIENTVVIFLERDCDILDSVLTRIRKGKGRIRSQGVQYLLTAVLDAIIDRQMVAVAELGGAVEKIETRLDDTSSDSLLGELYSLMRESIILRNHLLPDQEIFRELQADEADMPESVHLFLHDISDHHRQALEHTSALNDILKSMIDYQVSLIGMRTNKVMQFLTVIATIFIPLTFIAGVYGMNFEHMPELEWRFGYYFALGLMGGTSVTMLIVFIKKRLL